LTETNSMTIGGRLENRATSSSVTPIASTYRGKVGSSISLRRPKREMASAPIRSGHGYGFEGLAS